MKKLLLSIAACNLISAQTVVLDTINVNAKSSQTTPKVGEFAGSTTYGRQNISTLTAKNSTIDSVVRQNPNVIFNDKLKTSAASGEIRPQDFSINGASYYQNNFSVDGINFTNDIHPAGYTSKYNNGYYLPSGGSQAANLNVDLLESVEVLDSGVSARYGDFLGGVIKAKTRDPRAGFHGVMSSAMAKESWNKKFVDEEEKDGFFDKSNYTKFRLRGGLEGMITENFGLILDYSKITSDLDTSSSPITYLGKEYGIHGEKFSSENLFVKALARVGDNLILRPVFVYAPYVRDSFIDGIYGSNYKFTNASYMAGIEATLGLENLTITQNLSYQRADFLRDYENNSLYMYKNSSLMGGDIGGYADLREREEGLEYKFDLESEPFTTGDLSHRILSGFELKHKEGSYEVLAPYDVYFFTKFPNGYNNFKCPNGDKTCVNDNLGGSGGQYAYKVEKYGGVKNRSNLDSYAFYLEDEIKYKRVKLRPGVRFERNSFTKNIDIAPRFVGEFDITGDESNFIGVGFNRYYGRNFFAYKIYNGIENHDKVYTRGAPDKPWVYFNYYNAYVLPKDFSTPYDDEFSLFYRGEIKNAAIALKYVKRESKNEIISRSKYYEADLPDINIPGISKRNYQYYSNDGKTSTDIISFSLNTITPLELYNTQNSFGMALTYMDRKSGFNSYNTDNTKQKVKYGGKLMEYKDLPTIEYHTPFVARFMSNTKFEGSNFTLSNFITYTSSKDALYITGWEYDDSLKDDVVSYKKDKLPGYTVWDMRIGYEKELNKNASFFANLDINNVLNKKFAVSMNYDRRDKSTYKHYGDGRNFMVEIGARW